MIIKFPVTHTNAHTCALLFSVTNEQCSQVRDPMRRVKLIQIYLLQQAKRASTLFWFVFAHLVVRVEFLKQGVVRKKCVGPKLLLQNGLDLVKRVGL
jgi:hypothetical protein